MNQDLFETFANAMRPTNSPAYSKYIYQVCKMGFHNDGEIMARGEFEAIEIICDKWACKPTDIDYLLTAIL